MVGRYPGISRNFYWQNLEGSPLNPVNPMEGDMFIDPSIDKTFYYTGDRWVDITRAKIIQQPVGITACQGHQEPQDK